MSCTWISTKMSVLDMRRWQKLSHADACGYMDLENIAWALKGLHQAYRKMLLNYVFGLFLFTYTLWCFYELLWWWKDPMHLSKQCTVYLDFLIIYPFSTAYINHFFGWVVHCIPWPFTSCLFIMQIHSIQEDFLNSILPQGLAATNYSYALIKSVNRIQLYYFKCNMFITFLIKLQGILGHLCW